LPSPEIVKGYPIDSPTAGLSNLHETAIHDDARNPSLEACISPKVLEVLEGRDIGDLYGVLRFVLAT
jgi:hypothetical protein